MTNPPPPQGQNPYGQQQPGQPPQGQNPYGQQQPGQPGPGGYPTGGVPMAPPPAPSSSGKTKNILKGVVAVVAVAAAIGFYIAGQDDAENAAKGDCVVNNGTNFKPDVEVVDCGSSKAEYKVAEKMDGQGSCDRTKYNEYSETKGSDVLFTLCLKELAG